jgi:Domain of unknown function (DUF5916)/Carbohydrate family 9 binding domain-like
MRRLVFLTLSAFAAYLTPVTISAQNESGGSSPTFAIRAVAVPKGVEISMDGDLSQEIWRQAPAYEDFSENAPKYGAEPAYRTQTRILYDADALYVGIEAFDTDTSLIRAPLVRHDTVYLSQDFVALFIDPTGQRRAAQFFRINASGSKGDGLYTNDDNQDFSPDYNFEGVARRSEQGYTVVFRIPFASLRYARNSAEPWRIMIVRNVPRGQFYKITSVPVPLESASFIDTMQVLEDIRPPETAGFEFRPNITYQQTRLDIPGKSGKTESKFSLGADFKWQANSEWVVDGTLNPDFSQIELDVPQLSGNTRFALFFPEKRPFFLESADLLRTKSQAIYTRTITRPKWGLRATARAQQSAGTVYALNDEGGGTVLIPGAFTTGEAVQPASDIAGGRVVLNKGSLTVGGLASGRRYADGAGSNAVIGSDFSWQTTDALRINGELLAAYTTAQPDSDGILARARGKNGSSLYLELENKTVRTQSRVVYQDISEWFRNDAGFQTQSDIRRLKGDYSWITRNLASINELTLSLSGERVESRETGELIVQSIVPGVFLSGPRNLFASLEYYGNAKSRLEPGAGILSENYWQGGISMSPWDRMSLVSASVSSGEFADTFANKVRPGARVNLELNFRPLQKLEVETKFSMARLTRGGWRIYDEAVSQIKAIWHFDARQSLRTIWQRIGFERRLDDGSMVADDHQDVASITYAFRKSAGTVFYAGISRDEREDRIASPDVPFRGTEIFVKYQIAFNR